MPKGIFTRAKPAWNKGKPMTEEVKRKLSRSLIGRIAPNKGKPMSEGQKQKLRNRIVTQETRDRIAAARRGTKATSETRAKMSLSKMGNTNTLGYKHDEAFKETIRQRMFGNKYMAGKTIPEEVKVKISRTMTLRAQEHISEARPNCRCAYHHFPNPTRIEKILLQFLCEFPQVIAQKWFGRYRVDAYLPPPYHLAFEADGTYWHSRKSHSDQKRDELLLAEFNLPVVRLTEVELLAFSPSQK